MITEQALREVAESGIGSRVDLWQQLIEMGGVRHVAEVGVLSGAFAAAILRRCAGIARYYMIDPWRNLEDWNKPANASDDRFARIYEDALEATSPWEDKRVVLRGKTTEVIGGIPDEELDLVYIDGDHTLRGIAIDLIGCYRKVRPGGWVGGDDFSASIWQHSRSYEPTLVFPFAVYFAEAMDERIFALPHNQFLIEKRSDAGFEFCDLTGGYGDLSLRGQL